MSGMDFFCVPSPFVEVFTGVGRGRGFLQKALSDMVVLSTQYAGNTVFLSGFPLGEING